VLYYPKIYDSSTFPCAKCIAFEKYDGTNLHWDWDRDFGWHNFGTRRDAYNLTDAGVAEFCARHAQLAECVEVFHTTLAGGLEEVFRGNDHYLAFQSVRAFTEFLGPNSFAGMHKAEDLKQVILFDVLLEGYGMIGPRQFVADFEHLPSARVVYEGRFTGQFAEDVRTGRYGVAEGVIVKGGEGGDDLHMAKIKTYAYRERLLQAFADRWEEFWE
jgi:hypothetical protein